MDTTEAGAVPRKSPGRHSVTNPAEAPRRRCWLWRRGPFCGKTHKRGRFFDWLRRYRLLHIWLALDLAAFGLYFVLRGSRPLMNALTGRITGPFQRFLGRLCSVVPFSVMELLAALTVLGAAGYIVYSVRAVLRARGRRAGRACAAVLGAVCVFLTIEAYFCFMWGVNFWADGVQERSGVYAVPVSAECLRDVTAYFAREASGAADGVERDENGVFAVPKAEILAKAPEIYTNLETVWPFLAFDDIGVKPMVFSRIMSRMDFTGFYCSYTGEANVNVDSPACLLPATIAHEMAHQRGFSSEQECNFLAVLASVTSGDPVYEYSGYLMGYIYLGNALYEADPDAFWAIRDTLPETVRADLRENSAYWAQFRDSVVKTVSNTFYDNVLKTYGDERGMKSYGAMVDLLAAYYGDQVPAWEADGDRTAEVNGGGTAETDGNETTETDKTDRRK